MLNFLGVESNFSVLANSRWSSTFVFTDGMTGEAANLDAVQFVGGAYVGKGRTEYKFEFSRSTLDALRNTVLVIVPPLPEGRWPFAVFAVNETGDKQRMIAGYVSAIGELTDVEGSTYANRTLEVRLPGDANKRVQLEWAASTVAQQAAAEARAAAASVGRIEEDAKEALREAQEANKKLDGVDGKVQEAEEAKARAEEAARDARDKAEAIPREFIPTIVNGYWCINGQMTSCKAEGRDGKDGNRLDIRVLGSVDDLPPGCDTEWMRTCEGSGKVVWRAAEFAAGRFKAGSVTLMRIPNRPDSVGGLTETPLRIKVYERALNGEWVFRAESMNCIVQEAGGVSVFEFDGFDLEGHAVRLEAWSAAGESGTVPESEDGQDVAVEGRSEAAVDAVEEKAVVGGMTIGAGDGCKVFGTRDQALNLLLDVTVAYDACRMYYVGDDEVGYELYAWAVTADGSARWVKMATGVDASAVRVATADEMGQVRLGTDAPVESGAPVGLDADRRMRVPEASHVESGTVRLSHQGVIDDGIGIGRDGSGRIVALGTRIAPATLFKLGTVRLGSVFNVLNPIPYQQAVAADDANRLANNLLTGGALKHMRRDAWVDAGCDFGSMTEFDYYTGVHTNGSFTQSEADGLELLAASATRLGGVLTTVDPLCTEAAHVLDAAALHNSYMLRSEIADELSRYVKVNHTMGSVYVYTQEEFDKLKTLKADSLYIVY